MNSTPTRTATQSVPADATTAGSKKSTLANGQVDRLVCFLCKGTDWDIFGQVIGHPNLLAIQCRGCGVAGPHDFFTWEGHDAVAMAMAQASTAHGKAEQEVQ